MGAVYRAIDTQLDREVALKALRPELARRPDIVARFREEARIQGASRAPTSCAFTSSCARATNISW